MKKDYHKSMIIYISHKANDHLQHKQNKNHHRNNI